MRTFGSERRNRLGLVLALILVGTVAAGFAVQAEDAAEDQEKIPVKRIKMDVENWKWRPSQIRVQEGTKLEITIRSFDATHRFDLKAYGLKVVLPQDETTVVEFVADKVGEFKWKCGRPCGNGCPRMTGKLTVTPKPTEEADAG